MDAKSAIEAFEAIRGTVDPGTELDVFDTELTDRYNVATETAGSLTVSETTTLEATTSEVETVSSVASWSIPVELALLTDLILEGAHDFVGFEADEQTFASAVEAVVGIFERQMDSYRALGLIATRKGSLAYSFRRLSES